MIRSVRAAAPFTILALAGCGGPLSSLDPAGPSADAIATLWWIMFASSLALFALVLGLLALVWLRPGSGSALAPMRWIVLGPRLAGKIDAIPGHENRIRIQADRPGQYHGVCAEFCGNGHTTMRFLVEAHPPQDYEAAVREAAR